MKNLIAQFDEVCGVCEAEIPKGSSCYESEGVLLCQECGDDREDVLD